MPEASSCDATKKLQSSELSSIAPGIAMEIDTPKPPSVKQNKTPSKFCRFIASCLPPPPPQNQGHQACKPLLCRDGKNDCASKPKPERQRGHRKGKLRMNR